MEFVLKSIVPCLKSFLNNFYPKIFDWELPETISIADKTHNGVISGSEFGVFYFSKVSSTFEKFFQRINLPPKTY
jgi:hypothetical protein